MNINEFLRKFAKKSVYKDHTPIIQNQQVSNSTNLKVNILKMTATQISLTDRKTNIFLYIFECDY